jgi:hypothetical protein
MQIRNTGFILSFTLIRIRIQILPVPFNFIRILPLPLDLEPPMLQNDPLMLPPFHFDADPDPAFHFDADPDPAFHFDACGSIRVRFRIRDTG